MSGYWQYRPYVSVAERRKSAAKAAAKLVKQGEQISPVQLQGRAIAKTFWGKAWCEHLESFSDYENRLPRGRTYVRNGSVIHLSIDKGKIEALVQGSSLYKVKIEIKCVDQKRWSGVIESCSGEIESVLELLQGKLSTSVMKTITDQQRGLFPLPKEISLHCSCPDWAEMCKHVAAVLYGVGARLDERPELLFKLRHVDHLDLISKASFKAPAKSGKTKVINDQDLSSVFGIEIEVDANGVSVETSPVKRAKKSKVNTLRSAKRKKARRQPKRISKRQHNANA